MIDMTERLMTTGRGTIAAGLGAICGLSLCAARLSLADDPSSTASGAESTDQVSPFRDAARRQIAELEQRSGSSPEKLYRAVYSNLLRQFGSRHRISLTVAMAEEAPDQVVSIARASLRDSCVGTVELHGKLLAGLETAPISRRAERVARMAQLTYSMSRWVPSHRDDLFQQLTALLPRVATETAVAAAGSPKPSADQPKPTEAETAVVESAPSPLPVPIVGGAVTEKENHTQVAQSVVKTDMPSVPQSSIANHSKTTRNRNARGASLSPIANLSHPTGVAPSVGRPHVANPAIPGKSFIIGVSGTNLDAPASAQSPRLASRSNSFPHASVDPARQSERAAIPRARLAEFVPPARLRPTVAAAATSAPQRTVAPLRRNVAPRRNLTIRPVSDRRLVSDIVGSTAYAADGPQFDGTTLVTAGQDPQSTDPPDTKAVSTKIALRNKFTGLWDLWTTDANGDLSGVDGIDYTLVSKVNSTPGFPIYDYRFEKSGSSLMIENSIEGPLFFP